jgi:hypothetical protein
MNIRLLFWVCIISCALFFVGNVAYDLLDYKGCKIDYSDLFFLPLPVMLFMTMASLSEVTRNNKTYKYIHIFFCFFRNASLAMAAHYYLGNGRISSVIDWVIVDISCLKVVYDFIKLEK